MKYKKRRVYPHLILCIFLTRDAICTSTLACSLHGYSLMELDKVVKANSEVDKVMNSLDKNNIIYREQQKYNFLACIDNNVCVLLECFVCVIHLFCYTKMIEHCMDTVQTFHLQYICRCIHGAGIILIFCFVSSLRYSIVYSTR